ncbi:hypothetical protein BKA70DRAFT_1328808 [Coprinopsis sp. MPI-PUGE-AT-0042]|nr:hypothetical protein BKA70DRAFT_1328808 [Coprinopsis sp. MPI-PUGE-AT-0042]
MGQQGGSQHPFTFTAPQAPVYGGYTGGMGGKMYAAQPHANRSTRADTVVYADAQAPVRLYSSYSDGPGQDKLFPELLSLGLALLTLVHPFKHHWSPRTIRRDTVVDAPTPSRSESNEGRPNKKRKAVKGDLNTEEGSSAKKPRTRGRDAGKMPRTRSETKEDKTGKKMGENSEEGEKNKKKSEFGPKGGRRWKRQSARAAWSTKPGKQGNLVFGEICYDLKE